MLIDTTVFTPWRSLAGGALIGLAASGMILVNGRIAGISGIIGGLVRAVPLDVRWRLAFLTGLLSAPLLYRQVAVLPPLQIATPWPMLVVAGLLVGAGARFGAGCTSGHGVCGLARGSPRSLVATLIFMTAGAVVVYLQRHL